MDLYRRERSIDFEKENSDIEKKYFLVPLILKKDCNVSSGQLAYEVDKKLLKKVENITLNGYKKCQPNITEWLRSKGLLDPAGNPGQTALLQKHMLVKEDKPNSCYHFAKLLQNLKEMSAEDFAVAIKGTPE